MEHLVWGLIKYTGEALLLVFFLFVLFLFVKVLDPVEEETEDTKVKKMKEKGLLPISSFENMGKC